jgi:outer membrane protein W
MRLRNATLALVAAALLNTAAASGADLSVEICSVWTQPRTNGNVRPFGQKLIFGHQFQPGMSVAMALTRQVSLALAVSQGRIETTLRGREAETSRSSVGWTTRTLTLRRSFQTTSVLEAYLGGGAILSSPRGLRNPLSAGGLDLVSVTRPDHVALVVDAGSSFHLRGHLSFIADVKYAPFRQTAEVRRLDHPGDDLESDFNTLLIASGLSFRF